jgi:hypothetical protein
MKSDPRAMLPFGSAEGTQLAALTTATGLGAAANMVTEQNKMKPILESLDTWNMDEFTFSHPIQAGPW